LLCYDQIMQDLARVQRATRRIPKERHKMLGLPCEFLKSQIIYDGLCQRYSIQFGSGIRSGLNEDYLKAKQNGLIITSLEPETDAAKPAQRSRKSGEKSGAIVEGVVQVSERLRGGDAIQSAAFGLLRASAKVAQAALQNPDDLDELEQLARKAHNALNRLQTGLERAKWG
ncbi:MAG: hypothetical protein ACREBD_30490, partial [Blastocatellia bacterium]